jgi:peptidoglycan/LPS O-acetylase OafA/YrhL
LQRINETRNATIDQIHCNSEKDTLRFGGVLIILVLTFLFFVVLGGTIVDQLHIERRHDEQKLKELLVGFIVEFSATRTWQQLFSLEKKPAQESTAFINGVRVLALFWVILGHIFSIGIIYTLNILDLAMRTRNFAFQFIINGVLSVDVFFLLSGFLTAILFIRHEAKEKLSIRMMVLYYVHRYFRLTPTFLVIMFFSIYLTPFLGNGPLYPTKQGFEPVGCRDGHWWTSILYIGNLVEPDKMCLGVTWYLFNDMQFHWVAPLALIPFVMGRRRIAYTVSALFVLISIITVLALLLRYPSLARHALDNTPAPVG